MDPKISPSLYELRTVMDRIQILKRTQMILQKKLMRNLNFCYKISRLHFEKPQSCEVEAHLLSNHFQKFG